MPLTTAARDAVALPFAATLALLSILLVAAGCGQGLYQRDLVRPTSPEGKACLQRCELPKTQCRQRQEAREKECGAIYAIAKADYESCVKSGAATCRAPYTCLGADLSICEQEYDDCFAACGGRVERRLWASAAERPAEKAGASAGSGSPIPSGQNSSVGTAVGSRPSTMDPP